MLLLDLDHRKAVEFVLVDARVLVPRGEESERVWESGERMRLMNVKSGKLTADEADGTKRSRLLQLNVEGHMLLLLESAGNKRLGKRSELISCDGARTYAIFPVTFSPASQSANSPVTGANQAVGDPALVIG